MEITIYLLIIMVNIPATFQKENKYKGLSFFGIGFSTAFLTIHIIENYLV